LITGWSGRLLRGGRGPSIEYRSGVARWPANPDWCCHDGSVSAKRESSIPNLDLPETTHLLHRYLPSRDIGYYAAGAALFFRPRVSICIPFRPRFRGGLNLQPAARLARFRAICPDLEIDTVKGFQTVKASHVLGCGDRRSDYPEPSNYCCAHKSIKRRNATTVSLPIAVHCHAYSHSMLVIEKYELVAQIAKF
jgi:hypothetical protein